MAIIFQIKVVPKSRENKFLLDKSGRLVVHVKSAPEDGKANKEVIKFLAKSLKIAQSDIEIISGFTAPLKRLGIDRDLTLDQILDKLGLEVQVSLIK